MPAKHTLHVAPTDPLLRYIRDQVASGRHETASHVVRAGLRMLIEREGPDQREPSVRERAQKGARG